MVIAADGTKWSCVSCLKGHRVSGCNHTDRELKLVPKKGRPVTQCQHCRLERKKRSAHVRCDCAEPDKPHHPKEKCIHLREAEERNKTAHFDDPERPHDKDVTYMAAVAEEQGCCCHHGGKCSCALLRKNSTDDEALPRNKPAVPKPRLESTRSDSSITVFANGHHKPVHRNHAAHESGMPYRLPMSRSKTESNYPQTARQSVDNLGLPSTTQSFNAASELQPMPLSAQVAPKNMADLFGNAAGLTSNKLGVVDFAGLEGACEVHAPRNDSTYNAEDTMGIVDESAFDEWSAFNSADILDMPNNDPFGFMSSNVDLSNIAQPALTAASPGTQSEIDEIPIVEDLFTHGMPSIQEDANLDQNAAGIGSPSQNNRRSLPPSFFGNLDFTNPAINDEWQTQASAFVSDDFSKPVPDFGFNDPWQNTIGQNRTGFGSIGPSGRPAAHSVGSSSAPNGDVLKQLFPDMELDNGDAPPSPRTQADTMYVVKPGGYPDDPAIVGIFDDRPQARAISGQAWSDGSMSIPNDAYTAPYIHGAYTGSA